MVAGHLQVKKGNYYLVLSLKDENNKSFKKWISTGLKEKGNKKRAEEMLIEARRSHSLCQCNEGDELLFSDYLQNTWLPISEKNVETSTYAGYQGMIKSVIAPYFKERNILLTKLAPKNIQDFYTEQLKRVKGTTAIHYHAVIHKSLKHAVLMDMIPYNPADRVERPQKEQFIAGYYSVTQLQELFEKSKDEDISLLIRFTAFYGLRKSEALGLKWSAINFENGTIEINHTVTSTYLNGKKQTIQKDRTKNKSSYRTLPLVDNFKDELMELREYQKKMKKLCKECYHVEYEEYVFVDAMGELLHSDYVSRRFKSILKKNQLPEIRFHDLRHSCASLLLGCGVDMKQIQEWLGHSDYSTTANIYAHLQSDSKKVAASAMELALNFSEGHNKEDNEQEKSTG